MTQPLDNTVYCAECGGPLDDGSRFNRYPDDPGRLFCAVPIGSTQPCRCLIHEYCLSEIQASGSVNNNCLCGAGQIGGGVPSE